MLRKRSYSECEQERLKYRKDLIFFDLSTMVPADFHAGLREKEEEYRKIQEKEQENPNRIHKFIDYFDPLAQHFYHTYLQNPLFKRFMEFLGAVRNRKVEVCMVKMLGKRIKIVDKFVDPVWIFLFFFLNLTVFLLFFS